MIKDHYGSLAWCFMMFHCPIWVSNWDQYLGTPGSTTPGCPTVNSIFHERTARRLNPLPFLTMSRRSPEIVLSKIAKAWQSESVCSQWFCVQKLGWHPEIHAMAAMDSFSIRIFGPPGGEVRTTTPLCFVKILSTTPSCQHPLNPLKLYPYIPIVAGWKRHMKNCMWHQCAHKFGPCFDTSGIAIQIWSVRIMFSYSSHRCASQLGSQPWGLTQLYQGVSQIMRELLSSCTFLLHNIR